MNVNEIIGNNLKKYRSAYNMTLNELSERLHKSISTISKYEKGSIAMDIPTFLEISQIFQISPSILLSGAFTLSEDHSPTQKEAERLYMYTYSGMEKEIIQSLIEQFPPDTPDLPWQAHVYNDIKDFNNPGNCNGFYTGTFLKDGFLGTLKWLGEYRQLIRRLRVYFQEMGMDEAETEGNVRVMIEHMEPKTILCMIQKQTEQGSLREQEAKQMVGGMIHYGTYPVDFALYRQDGKKQGERSMADRGFQKPALLRHNRRGSYLQLEICETQGKSRVSGITMRGHLESLKYRDRGILCQADIRAGRLKIPLRVFAFRKKQDGTLKGILPVTVSASVGRTHMPESTALLIFWF